MKKFARIAAFIIPLVTMNGVSHAREPVPIVDYNDITVVTGSGNSITSEQIRTAITAAANGLRWEVNKSPNQDVLLASLRVRNKHTVVVSIPYSVQKYSIRYESSINMKYRPSGAVTNTGYGNNTGMQPAGATQTGPVIHPFYDRWVQELMGSIKTELGRL